MTKIKIETKTIYQRGIGFSYQIYKYGLIVRQIFCILEHFVNKCKLSSVSPTVITAWFIVV